MTRAVEFVAAKAEMAEVLSDGGGHPGVGREEVERPGHEVAVLSKQTAADGGACVRPCPL